jgi:hypothetical protein
MFQQIDRQSELPVDSSSPDADKSSAVNSNQDPSSTTLQIDASATGTGVPQPAAPAVLTPDQVCREFIACLQKQDSLSAERFLTRTSAVNARKAKLTLESPGSETAKFEFSAPSFANNRKLIATVACKIVDRVDEQTTETEISWLLKRDGDAWKIAGMILAIDDQGNTDFYSFENPEDIELIKRNVIAQ